MSPNPWGAEEATSAPWIEQEFLQSRGYDRGTMQRHGLQVHLANSQSPHPTAIPLKSRQFISEGYDYIAIPYWQINGQPLEHNLDGVVTRYCRWRKHNHVPKKYVGKDGVEQETQKYAMLKGTVPHAYFCKNVDWLAVAKDVAVPIVIVEGEFAAITCNEAALATGAPHRFIAIGGLWMLYYQGKRRKKPDLIAPFNDDTCEFLFEGRDVLVCYDVDPKGFDTQIQALARQIPVLEKMGTIVTVLDLSLSKHYKVGVKHAPDDFLKMGGNVAELVTLVADQSKIQLSPMRLVQNRLGVLVETGDLFDLEYGLPRKMSKFKGIAGHYGFGAEPKALDYFQVSPRTVSIVKIEMRDDVDYGPQLVVPAAPPHVRAAHSFNAWKGFAIQPGPSLIRADDEWERLLKLIHGPQWQWAEAYFAFMIQHPLERQAQSIVIVDPMRGYGKSCHTGPIHRILGRYAKVIEDRNFARQFSDAYYNAVLVQINEASIRTPFVYGLWQTRVSEPTLDIEIKGFQTMTAVPNYSRTIMSTNVPKNMCGLLPDRRGQVVLPKIHQEDVEHLKQLLHIRHDDDGGLNVYEALLKSDEWAGSILSRLLEVDWSKHYDPGMSAPNYLMAEELAESVAEPVDVLEAAVRDGCAGVLVLTPQMQVAQNALCSALLGRTHATKCFYRLRDVAGNTTRVTVLSFGEVLPTVVKQYSGRPPEIQYDGDVEQVRQWLNRTIGVIHGLTNGGDILSAMRDVRGT